ncbi:MULTISPECIES: hypothetical protein [Cryobacterium]|uniref:DUF4389 domain-containing protein n=1 Tax=Cryobacterium breve TaxID=1259258 RepID=A0ABY2J1V5_9MICO|nr:MULTISPECIES: hypothetical protein [Cryobacterium]TFC94070.1 hypothetical protein E3T20_08850 [Cryobacterium sp. TmT3-12]TFC98699.1 hypothetical protein E3O65_07440 [Cryobacterium breve]
MTVTPFRADYRKIPGSHTPQVPGEQTFWVAAAQGPGTQEIEWDLTSGSWSIVMSNADASPGVSVALQAGVRLGLLGPLAVGLLAIPHLLIVAAFTGRNRAALLDLILGIHRWIFRVVVYTALLRDESPPFRLDQGGADALVQHPRTQRTSGEPAPGR